MWEFHLADVPPVSSAGETDCTSRISQKLELCCCEPWSSGTGDGEGLCSGVAVQPQKPQLDHAELPVLQLPGKSDRQNRNRLNTDSRENRPLIWDVPSLRSTKHLYFTSQCDLLFLLLSCEALKSVKTPAIPHLFFLFALLEIKIPAEMIPGTLHDKRRGISGTLKTAASLLLFFNHFINSYYLTSFFPFQKTVYLKV